MKALEPPIQAPTVDGVLAKTASEVSLTGGNTSGPMHHDGTLISERDGTSTYRLAVSIDRSWDVFGPDDGASGHALVRVRPCAGGFEAFEIEDG